MMSTPTPAPDHLHRAGLVILVAGWVCALLVFFLASGDGAPAEASRREQQEVERLGGKMTVRMVVFENWLGSLWHGERLAYTIAVLSTAAGGACVYIAGLAREDA